jgi:NAD(P)-dependent dehydrogenase (short-subunit alcohol dehydrogenase family)
MVSRSDAVHRNRQNYIEEFGEDRVTAYQADFYNQDCLDSTFRKIVANEQVDVLVNNAYDFSPRTGFNTSEGALESSPAEQWSSAFESGIYWAVRATQLIGEQMKER